MDIKAGCILIPIIAALITLAGTLLPHWLDNKDNIQPPYYPDLDESYIYPDNFLYSKSFYYLYT